MTEQAYSDIGGLLSRQRKTLRLSVEQASRQLHIRARYLEALEQGRLDAMPGLAYTRGYLQSYAAFLGLDKEEILRRFEQVEGLLGKKGFYFPQVFSKEKAVGPGALWGGLSVALLAYLAWYAAVRPERIELSPVDAPPARVRIPAALPVDAACFWPRETLYPPCFAAVEAVAPLPLQSQRDSLGERAP